MPGHGILGLRLRLRLRAQDRANAETLHLSSQGDCATAPDCLQYMPIENGAFEWNLFPEYQAAPPLRLRDRHHVSIVVAGRAIQVYVNHAIEPTLRVYHMEGPALPGVLLLGGPAKYVHLIVTPAPADGCAGRFARLANKIAKKAGSPPRPPVRWLTVSTLC